MGSCEKRGPFAKQNGGKLGPCSHGSDHCRKCQTIIDTQPTIYTAYLKHILWLKVCERTVLTVLTGESALFLKTMAGLLARKNGESYAIVMAWLRTSKAFEILKSVDLCVRGSRVSFKKRDEAEMLEDFRLNVDAAGIFSNSWTIVLLNLSYLNYFIKTILLMTELFILWSFIVIFIYK